MWSESELNLIFTWQDFEFYPMDTKPKGFVQIINNKTFKDDPQREGSDKDAGRLVDLFQKRGFKVQLETDLKSSVSN